HRRQHRAVAFVQDCLWQSLQTCLELCWIALVIVVFVIGCSLSRRIESMRASCIGAGVQLVFSEVSRGEDEFAAHPAAQYAEPRTVILGSRAPNEQEDFLHSSPHSSSEPSHALDLILARNWTQRPLPSCSTRDHIHGNHTNCRAPGLSDSKCDIQGEELLLMANAAALASGVLQTGCKRRSLRKDEVADVSWLDEGMSWLPHTLKTEVSHREQEATSASATTRSCIIAKEEMATEDFKTGADKLQWDNKEAPGEESGIKNVAYLGLLLTSSSSNESHAQNKEFTRTATNSPGAVQQGDGMLLDKRTGGAGKPDSLHEGWTAVGEPQPEPLRAVSS
ncbi:unnamed protein product, partial [Closterium sp. NIES-53]